MGDDEDCQEENQPANQVPVRPIQLGLGLKRKAPGGFRPPALAKKPAVSSAAAPAPAAAVPAAAQDQLSPGSHFFTVLYCKWKPNMKVYSWCRVRHSLHASMLSTPSQRCRLALHPPAAWQVTHTRCPPTIDA